MIIVDLVLPHLQRFLDGVGEAETGEAEVLEHGRDWILIFFVNKTYEASASS